MMTFHQHDRTNVNVGRLSRDGESVMVEAVVAHVTWLVQQEARSTSSLQRPRDMGAF